jgi:DNA invertase Pin-like site-specific DNA recombinase
VSLRDAHIDTTTPGGRFTFQIHAAVAELERGLIQERVRAGVARAQAQGVHCGRPRTELDLRPALAMLDAGHGLKATAKALRLAPSTLRDHLRVAGAWPRPPGVGKSSP